MNIHVYAKNMDEAEDFKKISDILVGDGDEVYITVENRRSFRELEHIKRLLQPPDSVIVKGLASLGLSDAEKSVQIGWFIENKIRLAILNISSTYECWNSQEMNEIILKTIQQSLMDNNGDIEKITSGKGRMSNSGRNKTDFPDGWDQLYEQWEQKKISSKEFIERSGLKKGTFYNMLSEYQKMLALNKEITERYKAI